MRVDRAFFTTNAALEREQFTVIPGFGDTGFIDVRYAEIHCRLF